MQKETLTELIINLEKELLRLGYSNGSMNFYKRRWRMLIEFATENNELYYSEELGIKFIEKYFNISEKNSNNVLTQSNL